MSRSTDRFRSEEEGRARRIAAEAVVINGWTILAHPCFLQQVERLLGAVEAAARRSPAHYRASADYKLLTAIARLAFDIVPQDPTRREYRHGGALDGSNRHWFRARFGNGRFRLFFRYRSDVRIIVFAWVNDEETLRTYGSSTDAYAVFARMLSAGNPPDDWDELVAASMGAGGETATRGLSERLRRIGEEPGG